MRIRFVVPFVLLLAALVPGSSYGAACPPMDCGPTAMAVAGGHLLAAGLGEGKPASIYDLSTGELRDTIPGAVISADGKRAVGQELQKITTYDLASGRVETVAQAPAGWTLSGISADGRRIVISRRAGGKTSFAVDDRKLTLPGKLELDGVLGDSLYLIEYTQNGYYVRVASIATGKLAPEPLKDADEPALIQGQPWSRLGSRDGRYLFTLYITGDGKAMIHELDLRSGKAWCIDLPGGGDYVAAGSYALALSRDGRRVYAAGGGYRSVATVDVATHRIVRVARVPVMRGQGTVFSSASLAPDGKRLAFSVGRTFVVYDLARGRILRRVTLAGDSAVAYDARGRLWAVGKDGILHGV
ncbi:MAG TPA: hypothetical protein VGJ77_22700 [Gaiellaceae bacterium]